MSERGDALATAVRFVCCSFPAPAGTGRASGGNAKSSWWLARVCGSSARRGKVKSGMKPCAGGAAIRHSDAEAAGRAFRSPGWWLLHIQQLVVAPAWPTWLGAILFRWRIVASASCA